MAAALVPLIASVAPPIIDLIAGLVHKHAPQVEASNGPGTGPVKFSDLFSIVQGALTRAAQTGAIPAGAVPSDDILKLIIQTGVTTLKLPGGVLADATSATPPAPGAIEGTTFTIIGGTLQVVGK